MSENVEILDLFGDDGAMNKTNEMMRLLFTELFQQRSLLLLLETKQGWLAIQILSLKRLSRFYLIHFDIDMCRCC